MSIRYPMFLPPIISPALLIVLAFDVLNTMKQHDSKCFISQAEVLLYDTGRIIVPVQYREERSHHQKPRGHQVRQ